jgi:hypothetical protein
MARSSYLFLLLLSFLIAGFMTPAVAEKRVALVVGNSAYQNAPALVNPRNDAQDIGKSLRDLGFSTIVATDLDRAGMNDALDRFSRTVGGAEIALVYYSGHGMQFGGKNFLLPVEARLESGEDVNRFRLMPVDDVFDVLQGAPGARIVILDACRNNPVEDDLKRRLASIPGGNRDASLTRGFSRVAANGLIVAYATQANDVASDGTGRNSPFAGALLHHVGTPDLDLRQMLFKVQDEVDRLTGGKQRPELSISLVGEYKLKPATGAPPASNDLPLNAKPVDTGSGRDWKSVENSTSIPTLEAFKRRHPGTFEEELADLRIAELKKLAVAATPNVPGVPLDQAVRRKFDRPEGIIALYKHIIQKVDTAVADFGRVKGEVIAYTSRPRPKALVACINWKETAPTYFNGRHYFRSASYNPPPSVDAAVTDATNTCRAFCQHTCVLVDRNGQNALEPPPDWPASVYR